MEKKLDRRRFIEAVGAAGVTGLAGCLDGDGGDGESPEEETTEPQDGTATPTTDDSQGGQESRLSWHAGGTGGTYFPLSNQLKGIIEGNSDFTVNVQSTGASVENVGSLARGDADFALIQNDVAYFAFNGTGIEDFEGNAVENLRGVATLYPETIHIVTLADSGIQNVTDLEGKVINTGDLGSGTQVNALQILEAVGVQNFTEQNAGFSQASEQLQNGDIDAAFVVGGWPVGAIEELATNRDISIVSVSGDQRQSVKDAASWFADDTIPAGTYNGVDEDVETVSVQAMIATNAEQPAGTVEAVTQAIFENTDQLDIKKDFISKDTAQDGMSIDLHEGAAAYFNA